MDLMRKRARERDGYSDDDDDKGEASSRKEAKAAPSSPDHTERGHINFFADIKQGVSDLSIFPFQSDSQ